MKNFALASVCTKNYCHLFETMLHSFVDKHKERPHWYIFHDGSIEPEVFKRWNSIYKGHILPVKVNHDEYKKYKSAAKFYIYEAFKLDIYDRVICLDADLYFHKDASFLWHIDCNVAMHKETYRSCFNSGVVVIGKTYLNKKTYDQIKHLNPDQCGDYFGNDQKVTNYFFRDVLNEDIKDFGYEFNCFADQCNKQVLAKTKIIHYFISPFQNGFAERVPIECQKIWLDTYFKKVSKHYEIQPR